MASGIVEPSSQDSQGSGESQGAGSVSRHSKLVERLLTASASLPAFINDLLTTQAVVVAGTEAAAFILENGPNGQGLRAVSHIRPDNSNAQTRQAALTAFQEIVTACLGQGKDGAIEINSAELSTANGAPEAQFCLITLLRQEGNIVAANAVITRCQNLERARQRLVSMQLVAGYFELYNLKRNAEQAQIIAQSHQHVLQLATAVATAHGFEAAGMSLCNELASRTGAVRVTLGWIKGQDVKVVAFSHTEQFDKKQELVVELQKVMEECVDQDEPVHFVPGGEGTPNVTRAAAAFSRAQGGNAVLSLPLRERSEIVGVVVLEFAPGAPLAQQSMTSLAVAVDLLAPQLHDRYENDRWLITKAGISIRDLGEKAIGPHYMLAKVIVVSVAVLLSIISFFKVTYHVSAPFEFSPVAKTTISCPVDGYIETVDVRPGEHMAKGDVLLKLQTVELEKKLAESRAEAQRAAADAASDLVDSHDDQSKLGEYARHHAQELAAQAQADLYDHEIEESTLRAPAAGIILTAGTGGTDLEDQVNSLKKQGDELFTFQPDGKPLRAELSVAENDIQEVVQFGQLNGGELATTSLPRDRFPFTIERIDPLGQPKEGSNIFKVYASVPESLDHPEWRPGMEGEAKITIEKRRIVWIWTHKFVDWLRLKAWTWL